MRDALRQIAVIAIGGFFAVFAAALVFHLTLAPSSGENLQQAVRALWWL